MPSQRHALTEHYRSTVTHIFVSFAHVFSREVVPDICEQLLCLWGRVFLIGLQLSYRAVVVDLPAGLMGLWTISSNFGEVK